MYETCLRFIAKGVFEWLIKAWSTEVIFAKFGTIMEVIC